MVRCNSIRLAVTTLPWGTRGVNLTTGSSNIYIGHPGFSGDNNIIRIGTGQAQTFIAGAITGNGAGLTNLNAAQLGSGTLGLAQLPSAVITNNQTGLSLAGSFAGSLAGNGAAVTNVPASAITGGFSTNILIGGHTFYITNGIIRNVEGKHL